MQGGWQARDRTSHTFVIAVCPTRPRSPPDRLNSYRPLAHNSFLATGWAQDDVSGKIQARLALVSSKLSNAIVYAKPADTSPGSHGS